MKLRTYQQAAIDRIYHYYKMTNGVGHPLIDMCVGSGKSHVIAHFVDDLKNKWPDQKVLILVHVKELVEQNYSKLTALDPEYSHGINSAAFNERNTKADVIYGSIQSMYSDAELFSHRDLIIVDEAHLISKESERGMYGKLISKLTEINPQLKVIGFTGTPYRMKGGCLTIGENRLFTEIIYTYGIKKALTDNHLVPLISPHHEIFYKAKTLNLNKSKVGEYTQKDVDKLVTGNPLVIRQAIAQAIKLSQGRNHKLVFCSSIKHAEMVCSEIRSNNKTCEVVNGKTSKIERNRIISDFKSGKIEFLCNIGVLTTGFDFPALDCGILLRPTASPGLFVQIAGRFLRPYPGKKNALWLDFTDTTEELGPLDEIKAPVERRKNENSEPIIKLCEVCGEMCFPSTKICPECGTPFPINENPTHSNDISLADILSRKLPPSKATVTKVRYSKHSGRNGKPPTLKVTYQCGVSAYSEWVAFESASRFARSKAECWWLERTKPLSKIGINLDPPLSVDEALVNSRRLLNPKSILVDLNSKFPKVVGVNFL